MKKTLFIVIVSISCALLLSAEDGKARASILIDAGKITGEVNDLVFGQNIEASDGKDIHSAYHGYEPGRTGDGLWDPRSRSPVPEAAAFAKEAGIASLRYPGGCLVHGFDWHKAVGPLSGRPDFTFGIDEYIELCRSIGAEPLMTCADYVGKPQDLADLAEYCNATATKDPPWALKRKEWGHAEPYNVKYWEMGNESDHGNHDLKPSMKFSAESYSAWFNESVRLMKAVDPDIDVGMIAGTGTGPNDPWNRIVLEKCGGLSDFVVVHTYSVMMWLYEPKAEEEPLALQAAIASVDQFEAMLGEYRGLIREMTGRDIPLAITEYNAMYVQEKPKPFRFSVAAALFSGDYIRALLDPGSNVLMAHYWQFINGYWGMIRGGGGSPYRKMAAFDVFRLWKAHAGKRVVKTETSSPSVEFDGWRSIRPARLGNSRELLPLKLRNSKGRGYGIAASGDRSLIAELKSYRGESYPNLSVVPVEGGRVVALSFESRTTGELPPDARLGIDLVDSRGWDKTKSGFTIDSLSGDRDWTRHKGGMTFLPDCGGVVVNLRLISKEPIDAKVEIRDLKVTLEEDAPPYPALSSFASLSDDGKKLYLVVFNRSHESAITADVELAGRKMKLVSVEGLNAQAMDSFSWNKTAQIPVALRSASAFAYSFPKLSMTAFEIALE